VISLTGIACEAGALSAGAPECRKKAMAKDHPDIPPVAPAPRYARRLSDKILIAFHQACDQADIDVARQLLDILEFMTQRTDNLPTGKDQRAKESFVAAHERLWQIRHP
jgi:hypothetical protein